MLSALFTFVAVAIIIASTHPVVCQRWEVFEKAMMKSVAIYILLTLWFPYENWVVPITSTLVALLTFAIRHLKVDTPTVCQVIANTTNHINHPNDVRGEGRKEGVEGRMEGGMKFGLKDGATRTED